MQIFQQLSQGESQGTTPTPFTLDSQFAWKCDTLTRRGGSSALLGVWGVGLGDGWGRWLEADPATH